MRASAILRPPRSSETLRVCVMICGLLAMTGCGQPEPPPVAMAAQIAEADRLFAAGMTARKQLLPDRTHIDRAQMAECFGTFTRAADLYLETSIANEEVNPEEAKRLDKRALEAGYFAYQMMPRPPHFDFSHSN